MLFVKKYISKEWSVKYFLSKKCTCKKWTVEYHLLEKVTSSISFIYKL